MGLRHHSPTLEGAAVVAVAKIGKKNGVFRSFIASPPVVVADLPPIARHGGDSRWKSRRCCGGLGVTAIPLGGGAEERQGRD
ncbi:hypothetical protein Tco_1235374 [Tanacetum coccineum]